jgi:hypothetical protein
VGIDHPRWNGEDDMGYIENPKTQGSGIICCIPQSGRCPNNCEDCFFQSGRSYLEPLDDNLPNIPPADMAEGMVVRVNDGNDSNNQFETVLNKTRQFKQKFYNTSIPENLSRFKAPVVLTINPGRLTNEDFHQLDIIPSNLMFVRFRTNTWNLDLLEQAIFYYTMERNVPLVITFMAYSIVDSSFLVYIPPAHLQFYTDRMRTINTYMAIERKCAAQIMGRFERNRLVYSCGTEGVASTCRFCGNCLREYFATIERMKDGKRSGK